MALDLDALDVRVPGRRRRASDDEAEDGDAEFHDAAEYAASVADSTGHADAAEEGDTKEKHDDDVAAEPVPGKWIATRDAGQGTRRRARVAVTCAAAVTRIISYRYAYQH